MLFNNLIHCDILFFLYSCQTVDAVNCLQLCSPLPVVQSEFVVALLLFFLKGIWILFGVSPDKIMLFFYLLQYISAHSASFLMCAAARGQDVWRAERGDSLQMLCRALI